MIDRRLTCIQLRYVVGAQLGDNKCMSMKPLESDIEDASIAG